MNWIIYTLIAGLTSNLVNYWNRYLLVKHPDTISYAWIFQALRLVIFVPFVTPGSETFTNHTLLLLILLGIIEIISIYVFMKMHTHTELALSTIISRTRIIWVPVLAFIFLHETLTLNVYIGIIIIFAGLSIPISVKSIIFDKSIRLAFLSAFLVAISTIIIKELSNTVSIPLLVTAMTLPSTMIIPLLIKKPVKRIITSLKYNAKIKIASGFFNAISIFCFIKAIQTGPASVVTGLFQAMTVISIIFGIVFLKEDKHVFKKILGSAITLIGALLII